MSKIKLFFEVLSLVIAAGLLFLLGMQNLPMHILGEIYLIWIFLMFYYLLSGERSRSQ